MKKMILALMLTGICYYAQATPLPPGSGSVIPSVGPGFPPPGSVLVASLLAQPYSSTSINGTVDTFVYTAGTSSPNGGLWFIYQIHNSTTRTDPVEAMGVGTTGDGFAGFLTDASENGLGVGIVPASTVDRSPNGEIVTWHFGGILGAIEPGQNSTFLEISTNALNWRMSTAGVSDGNGASTNVLVPSVPDGGTAVALLGIALAGVEGVRRMFRARKS